MSAQGVVQVVVPFELEALANAKHYQRWVYDTVQPYLGRSILEIGAGVGNLSRWLPITERLILTESDPGLYAILARDFPRAVAGDRLKLEQFDVIRDSFERFAEDRIDTIVSFNVLEHIEDDALALRKQIEVLRASLATGPKRLVLFVPAHGWAYGAMDKTAGHFRRYNARQLRKLVAQVSPNSSVMTRYFNLPGLLGWFVRGRILGRGDIGVASIRAFERLAPVIRPLDDFLHKALRLPIGQSLLAVIDV